MFYDTCALLHDAKNIFNKDEKFFISSITLEELENIKTSSNKDEDIKYQARIVTRLLSEKTDKYVAILYNSIIEKLALKTDIPINNDLKIICSACYAKEHYLEKDEILVFSTKDLNCSLLASSQGLTVNTIVEEEEEYCGYEKIQMTEEELAEFYSKVYTLGDNKYNLLENEYLFITNDNDEIIDSFVYRDNKYQKFNFPVLNTRQFGKVTGKDPYQVAALDALQHSQLCMLRGPAGSGKSYLSFAYLFDLYERGIIDKIIIFCNTIATKGSAKLGFYPGSRDEKLMDSQIGNFLNSKIGDRVYVEKLLAEGDILLLPMSDIRGFDTTGMHAGIYITEAQNLDIELMRLALQRIGEDSICILDGDSNAQVDSALYAGANNGMRRVSEVFKGQPFYSEITLNKIHRSRIAELAQNM